LIFDKKNHRLASERDQEFKYLLENYNVALSRMKSGVDSPKEIRLNFLSSRKFATEKANSKAYHPFVLNMEGALLVGSNWHIIDTVANVHIRSLLFDQFPTSEQNFSGAIPRKTTLELKGKTLSAIAANSASYYHAVAEFLTKLMVCSDMGLTSFDQIVTHGTKFEADALRHLGFSGEIISLHSQSYPYLHCESSYLPSVYEPNLAIPSKITTAINNAFGGGESNQKSRILILRRGVRAFSNEAELKQGLEKYGFESYYLEDFDLRATAELFGTAEVIVGVHGAGLTNVIFSRPGAILIEIGIKTCNGQTSLLFFHLANQIGARHFMYVSSYENNSDPKRVVFDERDFIDQVGFILETT